MQSSVGPEVVARRSAHAGLGNGMFLPPEIAMR